MDAVIALAVVLLLVAAYAAGHWREHRRTAADFRTLRQALDAQQASLTAISPDAIEHRQRVAADHRRRYQASADRLTAYYLDMRRTVRHG